MQYFVALIILVLVYVLVKFFLSKVDPVAPLADVLGVVAGCLAALWYIHVI